MAGTRKGGGARKAERMKTKPEVAQPDRQTLTGKTVAQMAASRGITETALLADYRFSLEAHGETAEDRLPKEFRGWLIKFAQALDSNDARMDALCTQSITGSVREWR